MKKILLLLFLTSLISCSLDKGLNEVNSDKVNRTVPPNVLPIPTNSIPASAIASPSPEPSTTDINATGLWALQKAGDPQTDIYLTVCQKGNSVIFGESDSLGSDFKPSDFKAYYLDESNNYFNFKGENKNGVLKAYKVPLKKVNYTIYFNGDSVINAQIEAPSNTYLYKGPFIGKRLVNQLPLVTKIGTIQCSDLKDDFSLPESKK